MTSTERRLAALVALSRDAGASRAERVLAAEHAASLAERLGRSYLTYYPAGLPQ